MERGMPPDQWTRPDMEITLMPSFVGVLSTEPSGKKDVRNVILFGNASGERGLRNDIVPNSVHGPE